jgi:hypothetical protein
MTADTPANRLDDDEDPTARTLRLMKAQWQREALSALRERFASERVKARAESGYVKGSGAALWLREANTWDLAVQAVDEALEPGQGRRTPHGREGRQLV